MHETVSSVPERVVSLLLISQHRPLRSVKNSCPVGQSGIPALDLSAPIGWGECSSKLGSLRRVQAAAYSQRGVGQSSQSPELAGTPEIGGDSGGRIGRQCPVAGVPQEVPEVPQEDSPP